MLVAFSSIAGYIMPIFCAVHAVSVFIWFTSSSNHNLSIKNTSDITLKMVTSILTIFTFADCKRKFKLSRCYVFYFLSFVENVVVFYTLMFQLTDNDEDTVTLKSNLETLSMCCTVLYFISVIPMIFYYLVLEFEAPLETYEQDT